MVGPAAAENPLASAPTVAAARLRWLAAHQRARSAGILPDPMITGEYMRVPAMGMDGYMIEVEQPLQRWGERDAERAMATARLVMAEAEYAAARGRVLSMAGRAQAEANAADAMAVLDQEIAARARSLADLVARSSVATGKGSVREVLTLQSRAAEFDVMILRDKRMAADARGEVAAVLGLAADALLPTLTTPDPTTIDPERAPEARMAQARVVMANAQLAMAVARGRPEVAVMGRWRQQGEEDADAWEGGLRLSIPLWRDAYGGAADGGRTERLAALSDQAASVLDARELLARVARARDLAQRTRTWASETSARLDSELETIASDAATGMGGATAMLFERFDQLVDAKRATIIAETAALTAQMTLWALVPPPDTDATRSPGRIP